MVYYSDRDGESYAARSPSTYYRRLPGSRAYYNPLTGDILTEHQYVRRFRRGLSYTATTADGEKIRLPAPTDRQLASQLEYQRDINARVAQRRREIREQYAYDRDITIQEAQADPEFQDLLIRRDYLEFQKDQIRRQYGQDSEEYQEFMASDGEFAQVLVDLGLRPADADWMVGMSDEQPGWPAYYFPGRYG